MKIINKIEIEFYRSLKKITVKDVNHLNVFSGKNDIGKSNVLKALDTFFNRQQINFFDDFNKDRLEEVKRDSVKGKQFIKITVEFNNTGTYRTLPTAFKVSKTWDRNGHQIEGTKDNFESLIKRGKFEPESIEMSRRKLSAFLNKIRFTYIPAIRDERFFSYLLNKLQETIFQAEERKKRKNQRFQDTLGKFNETIAELTNALNNEFEAVSGIPSSLSFPSELGEIFQRLIIDTRSGAHEIPLRLRGDGIRLRYIPTILNYISKNSNYSEIWGFDEPENSCEYSLSQKIAEQFAIDYSRNTQIFVATHSFHFISLKNEDTSTFRVFRKEGNLDSEVVKIDASNKNLLDEELGILEINDELAKTYELLTNELEAIEHTKSLLEDANRPSLILEGESDNILFETAFRSLFGTELANRYKLCEHFTDDRGATIGSGAKFINQFLYSHIAKIPPTNKVIAIFDSDRTGIDEIKALKSVFTKLDGSADNYFLFQHKSKPNVFAITLAVPAHRNDFFSKTRSEYSFLSTELLLLDSEIPNPNRSYPTLFDRRVYSFGGDKIAFANRIRAAAAGIDFSGFQPTFDLIQELVDRSI